MDRLIDEADRLITLGVTELACRIAIDSASFERAAGNLLRAAGLSISEESLRKLVEHEGKLLLAAQRAEPLELDFAAGDCTTTDTPNGHQATRVYVGSDGVKVPVVTDAEKRKRRARTVEKRGRLPRRGNVRRGRLPTGKGLGRAVAARRQARGVRAILVGVDPHARRPARPDQAGGAGRLAALRGRASRDARLPPLPSRRLGHRQRLDRVDVQGADPTAQTTRHALGRRQCRSDDGVGNAGTNCRLARVAPMSSHVSQLTAARKVGQTLIWR